MAFVEPLLAEGLALAVEKRETANQEPDLGERVKAAPDREWEWG